MAVNRCTPFGRAATAGGHATSVNKARLGVVLPGRGGREADRVRTEPAIDGLSECSGDDLHRRLMNRDVSVDGRAPVVIVDHLLSRGVTFKSLTII